MCQDTVDGRTALRCRGEGDLDEVSALVRCAAQPVEGRLGAPAVGEAIYLLGRDERDLAREGAEGDTAQRPHVDSFRVPAVSAPKELGRHVGSRADVAGTQRADGGVLAEAKVGHLDLPVRPHPGNEDVLQLPVGPSR